MKIDKSTEQKLTSILIILFLIASTFIGVPLNGGDKGWIYGYSMFLSTLYSLTDTANLFAFIVSPFGILTLLGGIGVCLLPLIIFTKYEKWFVLFIPLVYILTNFLVIPLLIPFIVFWIILCCNTSKSLQ
ncbi:hypothetical protein [Pedobacter paludis]|nr:hypothetical protein [Pedobacter paludis]